MDRETRHGVRKKVDSGLGVFLRDRHHRGRRGPAFPSFAWRPIDSGGLRCSSVTYSRNALSERAIRRAQPRFRCSPDSYHGLSRSLRGRNDRSEKVENRGQIFTILRCIVVLFAEKSGKYGPILRFRSRLISAAQTPRSPQLATARGMKVFRTETCRQAPGTKTRTAPTG